MSNIDLNFKITADTKAALASLADLKKNLGNLNNTGSSNTSNLSGTVNSYNQLIATRKQLLTVSKSAYQQETLLSQLYITKNPAAIREYTTSLKGLLTAYKEIDAQAKHVQVTTKGITNSLSSAASGVERFRIKADLLATTLENVATKAQKTGYQAQYMGRQLITFVTAPVLAATKASIDLGINLNQAAVGLQSVLNARNLTSSAESVKSLSDEVQNLVSQYGNINEVDLTKAQTQLAKVASSMSDIQSLTAQSAQFNAVSGLNNLSQATTTVASLYTANGKNIQATKDAIAEIDSLSKNTNTSIQDVVGSLGDVLPVYKQFGLSISNSQYLLQAFTSQGIDFKTGSQALARTLETLAAKTEQVGAAATKSKGGVASLASIVQQFNSSHPGQNISFNDANGKFDLNKTITGLQNAYAQMDGRDRAALISSFSSARLAPAIGGLLQGLVEGGQTGQSPQGAVNTFNQNNNLYKNSQANQIKSELNTIKNVGSDIGKAVLPELVKFAHLIDGLVAKFQSLSANSKRFIATIIGIVAVVGPLEVLVASLQNLGGSLLRVVAGPLRSVFGLTSKVKAAQQTPELAFKSASEVIAKSITGAGAEASSAIREAALSFKAPGNPATGSKSLGPYSTKEEVLRAQVDDAISGEIKTTDLVIAALADLDVALDDTTRKLLGSAVPNIEDVAHQRQASADTERQAKEAAVKTLAESQAKKDAALAPQDYSGERGWLKLLMENPSSQGFLGGKSRKEAIGAEAAKHLKATKHIDPADMMTPSVLDNMMEKLAMWSGGNANDLKQSIKSSGSPSGAASKKHIAQLSADYFTSLPAKTQGRDASGKFLPVVNHSVEERIQQAKAFQAQLTLAAKQLALAELKQNAIDHVTPMVDARQKAAAALQNSTRASGNTPESVALAAERKAQLSQERVRAESIHASTMEAYRAQEQEIRATIDMARNIQTYVALAEAEVEKNSVTGNKFTGTTQTVENAATKAKRAEMIAQDVKDGKKIDLGNYSTNNVIGGKPLKERSALSNHIRNIIPGLTEGAAKGSAKKAGESVAEDIAGETAKAFKTSKSGILGSVLKSFNPLNGIKTLGKAAKGGVGGAVSGEGFLSGAVGGAGGLVELAPLAISILPIILTIGAAVALIVTHWKDVSSTMQKGLADIKKAFGGLISAVVQPFKNILTDVGLIGSKGGESGKSMTSVWKDVGDIFNFVLEVLSTFIRFVTPLAKLISTVFADAFGTIFHLVAGLIALFSGDLPNAAKQFGSALNDIRGIAGAVAGAIVQYIIDGSVLPLAKAIQELLHLATKIPHFGKDFKGMAKDAQSLVNSLSNAGKTIQDFIGGGPKDVSGNNDAAVASSVKAGDASAKAYKDAYQEALNKGLSAADANKYATRVQLAFENAMRMGAKNSSDAYKTAMDKTAGYLAQLQNQVTSATNAAVQQGVQAITQEQQQAINGYISSLQSNIKSMVSQWVSDANTAYDEYRKKVKETYDANAKASADSINAQIKSIDDLQKAQSQARQQQQTQDQILKDQQNLANETASYKANYSLDLYSGNAGKGLIDTLAHEKAVNDANSTIKTDQQKLADDTLKNQQDAEKQRLSDLKSSLDLQTQAWNSSFDLQTTAQKKALDDQLKDISAKNVTSATDATELQQKIVGILDQYGPVIQAKGKYFSNGWSDALSKTASDVASAGYWNGLTSDAQKGAAFVGAAAGQAYLASLEAGAATTPATSTFGGGDGSAAAAISSGDSGAASGGGSTSSILSQGGGNDSGVRLGSHIFRHSGGAIGSMSEGPSDVPATLQTGEYVVQRKAVKALGIDRLHAINNAHKMPTFHTGGFVDVPNGAFDNLTKKASDGFLSANSTNNIDGFTFDQIKQSIGQIQQSAQTSPTGTGVAEVIKTALSYLGIPYLFGGTDPRVGLDCSGLVQDAYASAGITLPRTTYDQFKQGTAVKDLADAVAGDLLFYAGSDGTKTDPGHVGIYLGGNQMIDAPFTGQKVRIEGAGAPDIIRRIISSSYGNTPAMNGPVGAVAPGTPADNQTLGKSIAAQYGWGNGSQWDYLNKVAMRESGWNNQVWNGGSTGPYAPPGAPPTSYAYGIAQALPYNKYPIAGQPPGYGGNADAGSQIGWMLDYIIGRYGSPAAAWNHELTNGWYHMGGLVQLAKGANIMSDGPAYLHQGETVLTKPLSDKLKNSFENNNSTVVNVNISGFTGSQNEIDRLVDCIQRAMPKYNRAKGMDMTRSVNSY